MSGVATSEAIWQDVECGGYAADLGIWLELAAAAPGPVLELGAGTGRVALALAREGHEVIAVDANAALLEALARRAAEEDLEVRTVCTDARRLRVDRPLAAAIAPMQFMHLLGDATGRGAVFAAVADRLADGGRVAAAVLPDGAIETAVAGPSLLPLPDVRELDGWVYSSQPLELVVDDGELELRRLRQLVSPAGELTEELDSIRLRLFTSQQLDVEAERAGLRLAEVIDVPPTDDHVGSSVRVWERDR